MAMTLQENIRSITQDIIYTANHTAFKTLHLEVEVCTKCQAVSARLSSIELAHSHAFAGDPTQ